MDTALAEGLDPGQFSLTVYVLRPDFPAGKQEQHGCFLHISLADAYPFLLERFLETDIVQVNGAFDPVVANAAAAAGVPGIFEAMHQVEPGGMHPSIDAVFCVSELVRSVQIHPNTVVIRNGIDTEKFSFLPGRRYTEQVSVVQVANPAKQLYFELGEIAAEINRLEVHAFIVGKPGCHGIPSLGVVSNMAAVYQTADVLFLLAKQDAFGLVTAEAMACGTLPIISWDSGAASFIVSGKNGWVVDKPEKALAADTLRRAIDTVATPEFIRMQRSARSTIVERYSRKHMLEGYQNIYTAYADRPRKPKQAPAAWMDLTLAALLFRHGTDEALNSLERFNRGTLPLEPHFLRHPMGRAAVGAVLKDCLMLATRGETTLPTGVCRRLRHSRVASPLLDALEAKLGNPT